MLAATPAMLLAARLSLIGCKSAPMICFNKAGIIAADVIGSVAAIGTGATLAGSTLLVGKSKDSLTKFYREVAKTSDTFVKSGSVQKQVIAGFIKGETASGRPLSAKTADYLRDIQKTNIDQIVRVYDRSKADNQLNVFGKLYDQVSGPGGSNVMGTTKVFATEKLSPEEILR